MRRADVNDTIDYLYTCRAMRQAGYPVAYTTDPEWLLDMAINRRAGWPDDPTTSRGSAMPVNGKYPKRAAGDYGYRSLCQLADRINSRVIVRECEVPLRYRARLAHRLTPNDEF